MTRLDLDPDLQRLGDALRASATVDLGREQRAADARVAIRIRRTRPRLLAGATGAVAVSATAVTLLLSASASPPAYAITRNGDGSVLVQINQLHSLPDANRKLTAMGIDEQISIQMATGSASVSGPVNCVPRPSGASLPGPAVKAVVGTNGTEVIASGNTGAGTWHLAACYLSGAAGSGNTGAG
jgi:hypothetical protein